MRQLALLIVTIFLFNACSEPEIIKIPEKVLVHTKIPLMKNLKIIDTEVPSFNLSITDYNNTSYLIQKEELILASKTSQLLRFKIWQQDKDLKFYRYQNDKLNEFSQNQKENE